MFKRVRLKNNNYLDSTSIIHGNKKLSDIIYPIGSIYMSVNNTNPSTLFGGTWVAWGSGRVPVGVDENDTDFNTVEKIGGEKKHTLTIDEMPSHKHNIYTYNQYSDGTGGTYADSEKIGRTTDGADGLKNILTPINNTGGDFAHNNLQPYITCYMWKRTA